MMEEGSFVSKTYIQIIEEIINTRLPELEMFAQWSKITSLSAMHSEQKNLKMKKNYHSGR